MTTTYGWDRRRKNRSYREALHYDWHWDFNTGNGEMGNWGVHVLDDALNVALQDKAGWPTSVSSLGTAREVG